MTTTRARRGALTAVATLLALSATACGSDGDDGDAAAASEQPTASSGTEEQLRQAVEDSFAAMTSADAASVHAAQSAACRELTSVEEVEAFLVLMEDFDEPPTLQEVEIEEFDGTSARVRAITTDTSLAGTPVIDTLDWVWEEGAWHDNSCEGELDEGVGSVPASSELAVGETHTWDDGISMTVASLTEVTAESLGDLVEVTEGHTPFRAEVTVVNDSEVPIELDLFQPFVVGATTGGEADGLHLAEGYEPFGGRLAPGETKEFSPAFSIDTAEYGTELTVQVWYGTETAGPPSWTGSLS
ncbi:hypothetical protein [Streptomyces avicenniae]|uniref:hypothetical protein n=1 Tax=Streptomyces avicenniae TaxID=500153 RepID=UPI00167D7E35|nr:hypothetical protein [Streptomyces avicenniae]